MIFQRVETQVNEHNKQSHGIVFIVSPRQYIIAVYNMLPWSKARAMLFYVDMFIHWKYKVIKTSSVKLLFASRLRKSSIWCQNGIKILAVMFSNRVLILLHKNPPSGTNRYICSQWRIYKFLFPYKYFLCGLSMYFFFHLLVFSSSPPPPHTHTGCWGGLKY